MRRQSGDSEPRDGGDDGAQKLDGYINVKVEFGEGRFVYNSAKGDGDNMKNGIKRFWRLGAIMNSWIERFSAILHFVIILVVAFVCSQAVAFSIVYLQLLNKNEISMMCFQYINIWEIISSKEITNELIYSNYEDVKMKIEFLMNISIALSGMLLSLVTFISYFKKNVDFRRKSCFTKKEIFQTGKDDIKIMCEYFNEANFVAVYSHSFEWVNKSDDIRDILTDLSNKNKLKLYTGNDITEVKERLKEKCEKKLLDSIQQSKIPLRFSYVERNNAKYLLYRQEEEKHIYIITVRENKESKYLLQVISQLVK